MTTIAKTVANVFSFGAFSNVEADIDSKGKDRDLRVLHVGPQGPWHTAAWFDQSAKLFAALPATARDRIISLFGNRESAASGLAQTVISFAPARKDGKGVRADFRPVGFVSPVLRAVPQSRSSWLRDVIAAVDSEATLESCVALFGGMGENYRIKCNFMVLLNSLAPSC